jgi:hypothetical protein
VSFLFVAGIALGFGGLHVLPGSLADRVASTLGSRLP